MSRTFLVTGGAGFIGSSFIRYVLRREPDSRILSLDNLSRGGSESTIRDIDQPAHRFVKGDIRDEALVRTLVRDVDVVVNFAAKTHVDDSIKEPAAFIDTNVLGTTQLINAAAGEDVPLFIQVSTDEVYGPIVEGAVVEEAPLQPSSPYAASKAAADMLVQSYARTYGYRAIITRSTNNYGPYQYPDKLIPLFVTNLLQGEPVPLYGTGVNERDWLYVEDNCAAMYLLTIRGTPGEIYNIGANAHMSNLALTRHILESLDLDESFIDYVPDRRGHDIRYAVDSTKTRALGWEPTRTLAAGLNETIVWYRARDDWWRPFRESS